MQPAEINGHPTIRMAGKDWPIPELAPRQIIPVTGLLKHIRNLDPATLGEEDMGAIYGVVHLGLSRAHPEMTREVFDDMGLPLQDAMDAFAVVVRQAGFEWKSSSSGEAKPQTPRPTGRQ